MRAAVISPAAGVYCRHMLDEEQFRNIVAACAPELKLTSARPFAQGWDFELWEANGELLFRFPKRAECAEALVIEAKLLRELAPALNTPVPEPVHVSDGIDAFPMPFFSYRYLPGELLRRAPDGGDVAAETGAFLSELHRFPAQRATELGVQTFSAESWRDDYVAFRERTDKEVTCLLSADEQQIVAAFWDGFLGDDRNFQFRPVLIHADLGLEHLLVDGDRKHLLGVIDFGDARVGDPALDFVVFNSTFGDAVLAAYDGDIDETFEYRSRAYLQIGPFHEVLYGQETNQAEFVSSGLEGIRARIVRAFKA